MHVRRRNVFAHSLMLTAVIGTIACGGGKPKAGTVLDEAMLAKRTVDSFPAADEDYFHDMDGGVQLTKEQVQGRNMWIVWTGGNDRLWDVLSRESFGSLDFLKTLSSHPTLPYSRDTRWTYLGLVNEPCFTKATGPDPNRYGLWLDVRDPKCKPDPFENEEKYKGVQVGARGKTVPVGSYYGEATGIVGLRLFPNPDFDEKARREWDSERYYRDQSYYEQRDLVKPYRVAMSCAFCHVGPNPVKPPKDPERPEWANLSSNVGAQFFWWDRVFDWKATTNEKSFLFQALHTSLPGTLDTSLVSTDNINNPRTMNAVYYLGPRMALAKKWGKETLSGGGLDNKQFNEFVPPSDPLAQFFTPPSTTWTPRVLKDGSDSVGALGALNRVYLNIGLFSEEWLLHFRPLIGGQEISPIRIADARKNSVYWQAIERQTPYMASFFLATHRSALPQGRAERPVVPDRGCRVDSSRKDGVRRALCAMPFQQDSALARGPRPRELQRQELPGVLGQVLGVDQDRCLQGADARHGPRRRLPEGQLPLDRASRPIDVDADQHLQSDRDQRHRGQHLGQLLVAVLQGSAVGRLGQLRNPLSGAEYHYTLKGGGRGFTRPASLVSLWSTAPFLQNNSRRSVRSEPVG